MSILLVGANGGMGRRYQAVLKMLGKQCIPVDVGHSAQYIGDAATRCEGIMIATPTSTHAQVIREYLKYKKPILCEKPVTKDVGELKDLFSEITRAQVPFRMVYQYKMLTKPSRIGRSFYNYFRHGTDGLYWDCLQIIGLARGDLKLGEDSPIWRCMINGQALRLQDMDSAYIGYVQSWFNNPGQDLGELLAAHEKTADLEKRSIDQ